MEISETCEIILEALADFMTNTEKEIAASLIMKSEYHEDIHDLNTSLSIASEAVMLVTMIKTFFVEKAQT